MDAAALLVELHMLGATVRLDDGDVRVRAPRGVLTPELAGRVREHKPELARLLVASENATIWRVGMLLDRLPPGATWPADLCAGDTEIPEPGLCVTCGDATILRQVGRCTACCLAAVEVVALLKARNQPRDISAVERIAS